ncbi:MAG: hypothetical protein NC930_00295 [Candidatus Omnitrophica bacterium]|nr:hypothetical protein [Candidatus Omnitrophota bacterium]
MNRKWISWVMLLLVLFMAAGCGSQADANKPIDQIQQEVQNMNVSQLESKARAYAKEIAKQTAEMAKVQEKLKGLSPTELFGEKAKGIKDELGKIATETKALSDRYKIYADKYKDLGGDINKIKAS